MYLTEDEAEQFFCPLQSTETGNCTGSDCIAWRWRKMQASDQVFVEAVQRAMAGDTPDGQKKQHKAAPQYVLENKDFYSIPHAPTHGYCGLAGRPEV